MAVLAIGARTGLRIESQVSVRHLVSALFLRSSVKILCCELGLLVALSSGWARFSAMSDIRLVFTRCFYKAEISVSSRSRFGTGVG